MKDTIINSFIEKIGKIKWFENCGVVNEKYQVISSIFEAYDNWNDHMLAVWEPQINCLEKYAQSEIGDESIDKIFSLVSEAIEDELWQCYCNFVTRCNLENETGLEDELLDFIKRDVSWACIETTTNREGFFTYLLSIYSEGYFPCSWNGDYPDGIAVVL